MKKIIITISFLIFGYILIAQEVQVRLLTSFNSFQELSKQIKKVYGDNTTTLRASKSITITEKEINRPIKKANGSIGQLWIWGNSNKDKGIAIVSTAHLPTDRQIITVFLHELGHLYGLKHCINTKCLMKRTRGFTLYPSYYLCNNCKKLIK